MAPGLPCAIRGVGARTAWVSGSERAAAGLRSEARASSLARVDGVLRRVALIRGLSPAVRGVERLAQIAAPALREAVASHPGGQVALLLAAPAMPASDAATLLHQVAFAAGVSLDRRYAEVVAAPEGAGTTAFARAAAWLGGARGPAHVVVGGVASPVALASEVALEEPGLPIKASGPGGATRGLRGEGAGFLVLSAHGEGVARLTSVREVPEGRSHWMTALRDTVDAGAVESVLADLDVGGAGGSDLAEACTEVLRHARHALELGATVGDLEAAAPAVLAALALAGPGSAERIALATGACHARGGILVVERVGADEPRAGRAPSDARSPAERPARVVWHDLVHVAASLDGLARAAAEDSPGLDDAIARVAEADRALRRLAASDLWDPEHVARLDAAADALGRLAAAIPGVEQLDLLDEDPASALATLDAARLDATAGEAALRRTRGAVVARAATLDLVRDRRRLTAPGTPAPTREVVVATGEPPLLAAPIDAADRARRAADPHAPEVARLAHERELAALDVIELLRGVRVSRGPGPAGEPREPPPGFPAVDLPALDGIDAALDVHLASLAALARDVPSVDHPATIDATSAPTAFDLVGLVEGACPAGAPEPTAAFVRTLVLASCAGDEPTHRALAALALAPRPVHLAIADGLALGRGSTVSNELDACLAHEVDEARIEVLARALAARRAVRVGTFALHVTSGAPAVRAAIARGLGFADDVGGAATVLLAAARAEPDPATLAAQLEALTRLGVPEALARARLVLDDGVAAPGPLLRLLALAGRPDDVELLRRHRADPWSVRGLGWLGHASCVETLLDVLDREHQPGSRDEPSARARGAAIALQRITGLGREGSRLAARERQTVDPLDVEVAPRPWRDHLARHPIDPRVKLRFGHLYDPRSALIELEARAASVGDRDDVALEAAARSSASLRVRDGFDDASLQRRALEMTRSR